MKVETGSANIADVAKLEDGSIGLLLHHQRHRSNTKAGCPPGPGITFDELPVRSWSEGFTQIDHHLLFVHLQKHQDPDSKSVIPRWVVNSERPVDVLADTNLFFVPYPGGTPIGPPSCAISSSCIAVSARARSSIELAVWTSDMYCLPVFAESLSRFHKCRRIDTPSCTGFASCPSFSFDGRHLLFLREEDSRSIYLSHREIFVVDSPRSNDCARKVPLSPMEGNLSLYPVFVRMGQDARTVYLLAVSDGQQVPYNTPLDIGVTERFVPNPEQKGSVQSLEICPIRQGGERLLVSISSLTSILSFALYDPVFGRRQDLSVLPESARAVPTLSKSLVSLEYFESRAQVKMSMLVVKPSNFDAGSKYPIALFVHGGPVYAWTNSWPLMWHPGIFAKHGFVVVMPNITGESFLVKQNHCFHTKTVDERLHGTQQGL